MKKFLLTTIAIFLFNSIIAQNNPAIEVTKDDQLPYTPQNLAAGDIINYIITVSNTGNVALTDINLDDPQATLISNFISNLSVGQQVQVTATHVVTQADIEAGYISNSATASCNYNGQNITDISDDTDPNSPNGNDDATITFITQAPELSLVLDDNLPYTQQLLYQGDHITYTLIVTNTGNVNLQNINITGSNLNISGTISNLIPGDSQMINGTHTITQADINAGIVSAQATGICTYNGNTISDLSDDVDYNSPGGPDDPTITFLVTPDPNDHDNDGIADNFDIDDDNDGIPDLIECNGIDPLTDNDGDDIPVYLDDDDNNNSIGDTNAQVETDFDLDGDGIPNHFDLDSDGDGLFDTAESGRLNMPVGTDTNFDGRLEGNVGANGLADEVETTPDSGNATYNYLDWDNDGTYDFLDIDDDNDSIYTIFENPDNNGNAYPDDALDTDNDTNPNYHDTDDDGDGILTRNEHPDNNGNGEPEDALDSNSNGIPDYLDPTNTHTIENSFSKMFSVFPNPVKNIINVISPITPQKIEIYDLKGQLLQRVFNTKKLNISDLPSGTYLMTIYNVKHHSVSKKIIKL